MTSSSVDPGRGRTADFLRFVPELRTDFARCAVGGDTVVWSPLSAEPAVLGPVATVMLAVIDGDASVGDLACDVHEEIGIPLETAQQQVMAIIEQFGSAGLLTSSFGTTTAADSIAQRELFVTGSTPCSENASRLGTETFVLRLGAHTVRVACDSRRACRALRDALADHLLDDDDAPLAFVLTAPQGLKRTHLLIDRSGFTLSAGRGLDAGLHALASHLTALLPPEPGTVRIRARAVTTDEHVFVGRFPLLYSPSVSERDLSRAGVRLVDRLALDVGTSTGDLRSGEIPWPSLRDLGAGAGHAGPGGTRSVAVVVEAAPVDAPPVSEAGVVARLAADGMHGTTSQLLDAAAALVAGSELRTVDPMSGSILEALEAPTSVTA